jgi:hypothetical protein
MPTFCEPWPGKTNASQELLLLAVQLGDFVADLKVQTHVRELLGAADGALHGPCVGAAVGDETAAVQAQQRSSPVLAVVHPLSEAVENRLGQGVAELAAGTRRHLLPQHPQQHLAERLGALQHGVADEAVANDHVHFAIENVPPLDVADEVEAGRLEHPEDLAGELRPLPLFLADRQYADARLRHAKHRLGVEVPHDGELAQMNGLAVDVGSHVEEHGAAPGVGQHGGEGRPVHPCHRADHHLGRHHRGTGVAGGDHGLGAAVLDQLGAES